MCQISILNLNTQQLQSWTRKDGTMKTFLDVLIFIKMIINVGHVVCTKLVQMKRWVMLPDTFMCICSDWRLTFHQQMLLILGPPNSEWKGLFVKLCLNSELKACKLNSSKAHKHRTIHHVLSAQNHHWFGAIMRHYCGLEQDIWVIWTEEEAWQCKNRDSLLIWICYFRIHNFTLKKQQWECIFAKGYHFSHPADSIQLTVPTFPNGFDENNP